MWHRGPDGAGLWRGGHVVLAHRRLAVVDLSPEAAQPMLTRDGRSSVVYNGELYNDHELRDELVKEGWPHGFRTRSDTETVLAALTWWGQDALPRLRGMFALAFFDSATKRLLLARDPLGIKPLYFHLHTTENGGGEIVFASEIPPILKHPSVDVRPDLLAISAYLTTIRTTIGNNTLFEGVRTLRPGEVMSVDLSGKCEGRAAAGDLGVEVTSHWRSTGPSRSHTRRDSTLSSSTDPANHASSFNRGAKPTPTSRVADVRDAVRDSVSRHLRADVPACLLLSGGLDSSIIAACAAESNTLPGRLRTYTSGATGSRTADDFRYAKEMARMVASEHTEAAVTREMFGERWREMVWAQGMPLSTPNEVAINHVARTLRRDGQVVALSGEGADELFGGYDEPMRLANVFERVRRATPPSMKREPIDPGLHQLHSSSWIPTEAKSALMNEEVWGALDNDTALKDYYRAEFASILKDVPCDDRGWSIEPLEPHLRFLRAVNLPGLLARLDSATMLASVEGRTPLADVAIASLAESLPMPLKYDIAGMACSGEVVAGGVVTATVAHTKRVLREAFADVIPGSILTRPKASFPLPFEGWMETAATSLRESQLAAEVFNPASLAYIAANPGANWRVAWPMMNLALWGARWWG